MIDVGELTSWLVAELASGLVARIATSGAVLVGDGEAPLAGGWPEGSPNQGTFTRYAVVKPGGSLAASTDVPLCTGEAVMIRAPYTITAYDVTRVLADELGGLVRDTAKAIAGEVQLGDLRVRGAQVFITSVTGATRDDSTYPKMWAASTSLYVVVARRIAGR